MISFLFCTQSLIVYLLSGLHIIGLNGDKDFPKEFLLQVYDRIAAQELKTRDSEDFISGNYRNSGA